MEQWKEIKDYEGLYEISNFGNARLVPREYTNSLGRVYKVEQKILKGFLQVKSSTNYVRIALWKDGKAKKFFVHRLVMNAFQPIEDKDLEINHIDYNGENNTLTNLEWVTKSQNEKHSRLNGRNSHKSSNAGKQSAIIARARLTAEAESYIGKQIHNWNILEVIGFKEGSNGLKEPKQMLQILVSCDLCKHPNTYIRFYKNTIGPNGTKHCQMCSNNLRKLQVKI